MSAAHPFFGSSTYPWARTEADGLYHALYQAIAESAEIERRFKAAAPGALPLNYDQGPAAIWRDALNALARAGGLETLCTQLLASGDIARIHPKVQAVIDAKSVTEQVIFTPDCIFVNRRSLREQLRKLSFRSTTPSVLLVRGRPHSGNSWTEKLVTAAANDTGAKPTYLFEGSVAGVEDVIASLFAVMGKAEHVEPRHTTEQGWYRAVCRKLMSFAQANNRVYWIIADDLGIYEDGPRLDPEVRRFFDQFALMMADPAMAEWFRLVLIDYPAGAVPTKWKHYVWVEDTPDAGHVDRAAVAEFLTEWAKANGKQLPMGDAERLAEGALQVADSVEASERLLTLHNELGKVVGSL